MLKMYEGRAPSAGSTPEYWDSNWEQNELAKVLADERIATNDPVHAVLVEKARPDGLFLEGGCGQAQWVKYFAARGYRAVGIDFANRTIERIKQVAPALDVRVGNILALPFADGEVHTYYSGGVVEHFEGGPEAALAEARRVLRADGWFLCSVPDESFLRKLLFRAARTDRGDLDPHLLVARVDHTAEEPAPPEMSFFQYAFTEEEFSARLHDAGFVVERTFGYGLVWGLMELPQFQQLYRRSFEAAARLRDLARARSGGGAQMPASDGGDVPASSRDRTGGAADWLRRALIREDRTTPLVGPLIDVMCQYLSNMRMFVARPRS
jgi:SAM-dependent methyltransferase